MPMPTGKLIKLSIGGSIAAERWSINFWVRNTGSSTPTPAELNTYALQVLNGFDAQVWSAATDSLGAQNSTSTKLDSCKAYFYDSGSLLVAGTASKTPVAGTAAGAHPAYVALCCTLLSTFPGRSKRGRVYLPATGTVISVTTNQVSSSTVPSSLATKMWNFLVAANVLAPSWPSGSSAVPVILSQHLGSTVDISGVRVDSLPDTQHGRSRKLVAVNIGTAP